MIKRAFMASALAAAVAAPGMALAVTDVEMQELREQVRQMKREYEQRIDALEQRLREAEARTQTAEGAAGAAARSAKVEPKAAQAGARAGGEGAFNPAVSLTLSGVYGSLSQDPARYQIGGFVPSGGDVEPGKRGFSLGESELALAANVDHLFRGVLIAALQPDDGIGVEEGYVQTLALSQGLTLKAGRFFSSLGYQNELHTHAWDFADAPLASKAFLGGRHTDDGLQLKWLAPTDSYFELGAEAGRGRGFPGSDRDKNGVGAANLFARLGGDIGAGAAWRLGLSHLRTSAQNRRYGDLNALGAEVENSFNGSSRLWVLDGVFKWAPEGNATRTNLKLQGEYFRRNEEGNLSYDTAAVTPAGPQTGALRAAQSGWYAQGVYQFMPRWRVGSRHDRLNPGSVKLGLVDSGALAAADFPIFSSHRPTRNTLMLDFNPSEFSRLRLQLAQDQSRPGASDRQWYLQYIMSLGAHGAHGF